MNAKQKRDAVLKSRAFNDWWEARQEVEPIPSDPYRAYMIDLSLHAKVDNPAIWEKQPNRRDQPDVDLPFGGTPKYAPSRKPRRRSQRKYKSPAIPKKGLGKEAHVLTSAMASEYGLPAPAIREYKSKGPLIGAAKVGVARLEGKRDKRTGKRTSVIFDVGHSGELRLGTKGSKATVLATAAHEEGHVIHARRTLILKKKIKGVPAYSAKNPTPFADELAATTIARRHLKKSKTLNKTGEMATANWFLSGALNSYRKGWKRRGKPVKVNKKGQVISGGDY